MKRHEHWTNLYIKNRYLKYDSIQALEERFFGILRNLTDLNNVGQIKCLHPQENDFDFMQLFNDLLIEYQLRKVNLPSAIKNQNSIPKSQIIPSIEDKLLELGIQVEKCLFKYGKAQYLEAGSLRVSNVQKFEEHRNSAIQDNENSLETYINPHKCTITHQKSGNIIQPTSNIKVRHQMKEKYQSWFTYCLAKNYKLRLFEDFEADSCLVIFDVPMFIDLINHFFQKQQQSLFGLAHKSIKYIDPFNPIPLENNTYFYKDFKYAYQKEFRILWLPPDDYSKSQEYFDLNIPIDKLKLCSFLHRLEQSGGKHG